MSPRRIPHRTPIADDTVICKAAATGSKVITRRTGKKGGGIPAISTRAPRRRLARIARGFAAGRVLASIAGARAVVLLGTGDAAASHRDKANAAPPMRRTSA
ncbi:hypothetical protein GmRootV118_31550 [Variovorax sp. V118]